MSLSRFIPAHSLRTKIILGYALIFLLVSVFIYTYFPFKHKQQAIRAIELRIDGVTDMMIMGVGIGMSQSNKGAIGEVIRWARKDSSLAYIVVLDQDREQVSTYQVNNLDVNVGQLLKLDDGFEDRRIVHYRRPLIYQDKLFGILLIGYSLRNLDKDVVVEKELSLYICLAIFGFGLLLAIALSTRITTNIKQLSEQVNHVGEGNSDMRISVSNSDEIGKLGEAFNNMLARLNHSRQELLASNQYTENIIMSMLDSLLVLDCQHRIIRANRAACQLFDYPEEELLRKKLDNLCDQKNAPLTDYFLPLLKETGHVQSYESILITRTGKPIHVLFSASLLRDRHGAHQGIVCVAQDISERKKAEAQLKEYFAKLEKSSQEMEKFNYVVSHDLKGPLRALFKLSEWIEEDAENSLSEESRKNFALMRGRVTRMEALINGLLAYSQTGRLIKLPELVSVKQLVEEVVQQLDPGNNVKMCLPPNLPTFVTQRKRLQNVFGQLISNAIRFNDKPEVKIKVRVTELENFYQFAVEDNGHGIESQYHEKVFAIFQTLNARDRVESTGMGLTIARKIVEEHGGKIWLESIIEQGTVFFFTWPKES